MMPFGDGVRPLPQITWYGIGTSTAAFIQMPGTVPAGSIAVMFDLAYNADASLPTEVIPSGWTKATGQALATVQGGRLDVHYRICNGTEAGASYTGMTGTYSQSKTLFVFGKNFGTWTNILTNFAIGHEIPAGFGSGVSTASDSGPLILVGCCGKPAAEIPEWVASTPLSFDGYANDAVTPRLCSAYYLNNTGSPVPANKVYCAALGSTTDDFIFGGTIRVQ